MSRTPADWRGWLLDPPVWTILAAAALFAVDQFVYQRVGSSILPQAPLDWIDHLLTTVFIVWATRPLIGRRQLVPALVASVVLDADHIPGYLGSDALTAGTHRPYTHSLLTILVLLAIAMARPRWRWWTSGAALAVASHLWRDLAEPQGAGVALLWPASDRSITTPAWLYLGSIALFAALALWRAMSRGTRGIRGHGPDRVRRRHNPQHAYVAPVGGTEPTRRAPV